MFFPEIVTRHPPAFVGLPGVEAYLLQAGSQQFVFMCFETDVEIPEHSHAAQWGVVLEGELELTIAGERRILRRGDTYFIPAGVRHASRVHRGYQDLTLFDQPDRYPAPLAERSASLRAEVPGRSAQLGERGGPVVDGE